MAHLFLLVHLLLGFELFRSRFGPYSLLAFAKSKYLRLEKRVLDSLSEVHVLFIIHTRVVLYGLLYTSKKN